MGRLLRLTWNDRQRKEDDSHDDTILGGKGCSIGKICVTHPPQPKRHAKRQQVEFSKGMPERKQRKKGYKHTAHKIIGPKERFFHGMPKNERAKDKPQSDHEFNDARPHTTVSLRLVLECTLPPLHKQYLKHAPKRYAITL